jgi:uncharacterized protein (TIGR03435 family)
MKGTREGARSRCKCLFLVSAVTAFIILLAPPTIAQSQSEPLKFEVASVKLNDSPDFRALQLQFLPGGRLVARNAPLRMIISKAYNIPPQSQRLEWAPEWGDAISKAYDIEARAAEGAIKADLPPADRDEKLRLMLQALLKERFKLSLRIDHKAQPVYVLVVAKGGPKLEKAKLQEKDCVEGENGPPAPCHAITGGQGRGIHGEAISIPDVVFFVQNWTERPLIDKTGLKGFYNIQTNGWRPMRGLPGGEGAPAPQGGDAGLYDPERQTLPDVFSSLGLRMESQRAVIDMFVIDHVEQPTEN